MIEREESGPRHFFGGSHSPVNASSSTPMLGAAATVPVAKRRSRVAFVLVDDATSPQLPGGGGGFPPSSPSQENAHLIVTETRTTTDEQMISPAAEAAASSRLNGSVGSLDVSAVSERVVGGAPSLVLLTPATGTGTGTTTVAAATSPADVAAIVLASSFSSSTTPRVTVISGGVDGGEILQQTIATIALMEQQQHQQPSILMTSQQRLHNTSLSSTDPQRQADHSQHGMSQHNIVSPFVSDLPFSPFSPSTPLGPNLDVMNNAVKNITHDDSRATRPSTLCLSLAGNSAVSSSGASYVKLHAYDSKARPTRKSLSSSATFYQQQQRSVQHDINTRTQEGEFEGGDRNDSSSVSDGHQNGADYDYDDYYDHDDYAGDDGYTQRDSDRQHSHADDDGANTYHPLASSGDAFDHHADVYFNHFADAVAATDNSRSPQHGGTHDSSFNNHADNTHDGGYNVGGEDDDNDNGIAIASPDVLDDFDPYDFNHTLVEGDNGDVNGSPEAVGSGGGEEGGGKGVGEVVAAHGVNIGAAVDTAVMDAGGHNHDADDPFANVDPLSFPPANEKQENAEHQNTVAASGSTKADTDRAVSPPFSAWPPAAADGAVGCAVQVDDDDPFAFNPHTDLTDPTAVTENLPTIAAAVAASATNADGGQNAIPQRPSIIVIDRSPSRSFLRRESSEQQQPFMLGSGTYTNASSNRRLSSSFNLANVPMNNTIVSNNNFLSANNSRRTSGGSFYAGGGAASGGGSSLGSSNGALTTGQSQRPLSSSGVQRSQHQQRYPRRSVDDEIAVALHVRHGKREKSKDDADEKVGDADGGGGGGGHNKGASSRAPSSVRMLDDVEEGDLNNTASSSSPMVCYSELAMQQSSSEVAADAAGRRRASETAWKLRNASSSAMPAENAVSRAGVSPSPFSFSNTTGSGRMFQTGPPPATQVSAAPAPPATLLVPYRYEPSADDQVARSSDRDVPSPSHPTAAMTSETTRSSISFAPTIPSLPANSSSSIMPKSPSYVACGAHAVAVGGSGVDDGKRGAQSEQKQMALTNEASSFSSFPHTLQGSGTALLTVSASSFVAAAAVLDHHSRQYQSELPSEEEEGLTVTATAAAPTAAAPPAAARPREQSLTSAMCSTDTAATEATSAPKAQTHLGGNDDDEDTSNTRSTSPFHGFTFGASPSDEHIEQHNNAVSDHAAAAERSIDSSPALAFVAFATDKNNAETDVSNKENGVEEEGPRQGSDRVSNVKGQNSSSTPPSTLKYQHVSREVEATSVGVGDCDVKEDQHAHSNQNEEHVFSVDGPSNCPNNKLSAGGVGNESPNTLQQQQSADLTPSPLRADAAAASGPSALAATPPPFPHPTTTPSPHHRRATLVYPANAFLVGVRSGNQSEASEPSPAHHQHNSELSSPPHASTTTTTTTPSPPTTARPTNVMNALRRASIGGTAMDPTAFPPNAAFFSPMMGGGGPAAVAGVGNPLHDHHDGDDDHPQQPDYYDHRGIFSEDMSVGDSSDIGGGYGIGGGVGGGGGGFASSTNTLRNELIAAPTRPPSVALAASSNTSSAHFPPMSSIVGTNCFNNTDSGNNLPSSSSPSSPPFSPLMASASPLPTVPATATAGPFPPTHRRQSLGVGIGMAGPATPPHVPGGRRISIALAKQGNNGMIVVGGESDANASPTTISIPIPPPPPPPEVVNKETPPPPPPFDPPSAWQSPDDGPLLPRAAGDTNVEGETQTADATKGASEEKEPPAVAPTYFFARTSSSVPSSVSTPSFRNLDALPFPPGESISKEMGEAKETLLDKSSSSSSSASLVHEDAPSPQTAKDCVEEGALVVERTSEERSIGKIAKEAEEVVTVINDRAADARLRSGTPEKETSPRSNKNVMTTATAITASSSPTDNTTKPSNPSLRIASLLMDEMLQREARVRHEKEEMDRITLAGHPFGPIVAAGGGGGGASNTILSSSSVRQWGQTSTSHHRDAAEPHRSAKKKVFPLPTFVASLGNSSRSSGASHLIHLASSTAATATASGGSRTVDDDESWGREKSRSDVESKSSTSSNRRHIDNNNDASVGPRDSIAPTTHFMSVPPQTAATAHNSSKWGDEKRKEEEIEEVEEDATLTDVDTMVNMDRSAHADGGNNGAVVAVVPPPHPQTPHRSRYQQYMRHLEERIVVVGGGGGKEGRDVSPPTPTPPRQTHQNVHQRRYTVTPPSSTTATSAAEDENYRRRGFGGHVLSASLQSAPAEEFVDDGVSTSPTQKNRMLRFIGGGIVFAGPTNAREKLSGSASLTSQSNTTISNTTTPTSHSSNGNDDRGSLTNPAAAQTMTTTTSTSALALPSIRRVNKESLRSSGRRQGSTFE